MFSTSGVSYPSSFRIWVRKVSCTTVVQNYVVEIKVIEMLTVKTDWI